MLRAAGNGELQTSAGLATQVERLMGLPRIEDGMRAFFEDMLQLETFDAVSKDGLLYPKWGSGMRRRQEKRRCVQRSG